VISQEGLIEYFKDKHVTKVFFERLTLSNGNPGIMYLYNYNSELQNFKESFGLYLPIYVKNEDNLETMDFTDDIDAKLEYYSKRIWNESKVIAHRQTKINGIYGELFLDIYLRVVLKTKLLISYASKRSFNSGFESKGIDSMGYVFNGNQIEIYLSEAKFVSNKSTVKKELLSDIKFGHSTTIDGVTKTSPAHLTKNFLDDYFGFVLDKDISCPMKDRTQIKSIFDYFNNEINKVGSSKKFTDLLIEKKIKVHFICFAIFKAEEKKPDELNEIYKEIMDAIATQFSIIGISNFSSEIIFVPTMNQSMEIKKEIDSFYE